MKSIYRWIFPGNDEAEFQRFFSSNFHANSHHSQLSLKDKFEGFSKACKYFLNWFRLSDLLQSRVACADDCVNRKSLNAPDIDTCFWLIYLNRWNEMNANCEKNENLSADEKLNLVWCFMWIIYTGIGMDCLWTHYAMIVLANLRTPLWIVLKPPYPNFLVLRTLDVKTMVNRIPIPPFPS